MNRSTNSVTPQDPVRRRNGIRSSCRRKYPRRQLSLCARSGCCQRPPVPHRPPGLRVLSQRCSDCSRKIARLCNQPGKSGRANRDSNRSWMFDVYNDESPKYDDRDTIWLPFTSTFRDKKACFRCFAQCWRSSYRLRQPVLDAATISTSAPKRRRRRPQARSVIDRSSTSFRRRISWQRNRFLIRPVGEETVTTDQFHRDRSRLSPHQPWIVTTVGSMQPNFKLACASNPDGFAR
jgi:hypothetical protein